MYCTSYVAKECNFTMCRTDKNNWWLVVNDKSKTSLNDINLWGVGIWYIFVWDKSVGIMSFLDMTEWKRLCEIRDEGMKIN